MWASLCRSWNKTSWPASRWPLVASPLVGLTSHRVENPCETSYKMTSWLIDLRFLESRAWSDGSSDGPTAQRNGQIVSRRIAWLTRYFSQPPIQYWSSGNYWCGDKPQFEKDPDEHISERDSGLVRQPALGPFPHTFRVLHSPPSAARYISPP